MSKMNSLRSQQGVVIVVALFIVALVATMSYVMMSRLARDTRRTELIVHDVQAAFYAEGSVMWAKDTLHQNFIKQKKDKPVDVLPIKSPVNDVNGYRIMSTIQDAQGRFNINNVSKPEGQADLIRLMRLVHPKLSQQAATAIAKATMDWLMPGANDNEYARYYADLPVPYRPAHRLMVDPGELRLVKGVTPELYEALKPYITALPEVTPINVLSAEPQVLALLNQTMTLETASAIREVIVKTPPPTMAAFSALDIIKNHPITEGRATFVSSYFLVETEVGIERQRILLYTLLQRASVGKAGVSVLWQNRGSG
jgi:general secretion pathway protein K